ncbi:MAG: hypothetical protein P0107_02000 [Nitrosomonas sp.]|nr:hypothetical protein [Nitrosomonas sp.]
MQLNMTVNQFCVTDTRCSIQIQSGATGQGDLLLFTFKVFQYVVVPVMP